ncbi:solute carrier family 35, member E4, partial [Columba livia]
PQVPAAESAAAGGPVGRAPPALPDVPAQLLPALRGGRGAGAGPLLGGRPALRRDPLGLRPAQLPGLRALQPGHLLRPLPHLRPHRPRPGQHHCGGQPAAVPPALRHPPERAGLPGHRPDAGRDVHVPPAAPHRRALGGTAGTGAPPAGVGTAGDRAGGGQSSAV